MLNSARNTKRDKKNQKIIFLLKLIKLGPSKSSHWKKGRSFVIQTALQIFEPFCGTIARWLSNYPFIKSMRVCVRKVDGLVLCARGVVKGSVKTTLSLWRMSADVQDLFPPISETKYC